MKCIVPKTAVTRDEQLRYLDDLDEALRRAHNVKSADLCAGKLSREDRETYLEGWFNPRSEATRLAIGALARERATEIMEQPDEALKSIDLDAAFEDDKAR